MRIYLYIMVVAAATTYLGTPLIRRLARRIGAITPVRDRDVHTVPIPRMGGGAMLIGFVVAMLAASQMPFLKPVFDDHAPFAVLFGAVAVCLLGVADDLWGLDALTKFTGQALIAGVMAWQGIQFVSLPIAGVTVLSSGTLKVLTVVAIVGTMNAVNFVDGLDGLAAGIVGIAGSAFFIYSYLLSRHTGTQAHYSLASLASLVTAALVGCCVGFLPHNFNPARVFMGDTGSMLIGLLLASATVAITGQVDPEQVADAQIAPAFFPLALPIAVLALPTIDILLAVVRRTRAGKMPWQPDKMHLHHRLLRLGHSHASAVMIMYLWTATFAFGVASVAFVTLAAAAGMTLSAALVALVLTLGPLRGRGRRAAAHRAVQ